jgi:hypothetical protein
MDQNLKDYLAQQDPKVPGRCFTKAGLTPRRLAGSRDKTNTGRIVWGQNCDGWRHFDCIGLVVFALQDVLKKPLQGREIFSWPGRRALTVSGKSLGSKTSWTATWFPGRVRKPANTNT